MLIHLIPGNAITDLSVSKVQGELCHRDIHFPYAAVTGQATVDMVLPRVPIRMISMLILPLVTLCFATSWPLLLWGPISPSHLIHPNEQQRLPL